MIVENDFNVNRFSVTAPSRTLMDILVSQSQYPAIFSNTRTQLNTLFDKRFLSWETSFNGYVSSYDISDHLPIIRHPKVNSTPALNEKLILRQYNNDKNAAKFRESLSLCNWSGMYDNADVNSDAIIVYLQFFQILRSLLYYY